MKVWPLLLLALAACCPAPLQRQATAFRAEVMGVSPEVSALHLKGPQGAPPLTLVLTDGVLRSSTGQGMPLSSLRAGDSVYVQGFIQGSLDDGVLATTVRKLE